MSPCRWLRLSLAVAVSVGITGGKALAQAEPGNWLYEQTKQQILDAEKKALENKPVSESSDGEKKQPDSDKPDVAEKKAPEIGDTKEAADGGEKKDSEAEKKADAEKKDDAQKKADAEKQKKPDDDKKKVDEQKKAEEKKKEEEKLAEEKKKEEEKAEKEKKKEEEQKVAYDPLKDAMFDLNAKRYDEGIAILKKLLSTEPKNVHAHYILAVTYVMKRQYPLAAEQYKRVTELAPKSNIAKLAEEGLQKINVQTH
jgi:hypothetical protein